MIVVVTSLLHSRLLSPQRYPEPGGHSVTLNQRGPFYTIEGHNVLLLQKGRNIPISLTDRLGGNLFTGNE